MDWGVVCGLGVGYEVESHEPYVQCRLRAKKWLLSKIKNLTYGFLQTSTILITPARTLHMTLPFREHE